MVHLVQPYVMN
ncbi:hypothetical protein BLA29_006773 [Euroglyphus maynei]|uniref:Uncharacterized protein n=1 Tax=Euroglyphus maynei TaxID=6958 RepID=A0A1Y3APG7_EURMA|nr:hypothetical protein BLA29_006773 [Euroglyphus maynei]